MGGLSETLPNQGWMSLLNETMNELLSFLFCCFRSIIESSIDSLFNSPFLSFLCFNIVPIYFLCSLISKF